MTDLAPYYISLNRSLDGGRLVVYLPWIRRHMSCHVFLSKTEDYYGRNTNFAMAYCKTNQQIKK